MAQRAQGWYRDPFGIHEDRYFSDGLPTKLVRDDGTESYDPPPDRAVPDALTSAEGVASPDGVTSADRRTSADALTPAESPDAAEADQSDLRRADDAAEQPAYRTARAIQIVLDIFSARGHV